MSTPRIVSLLASATEFVCALGRRDDLVGRSHECDWPPGIEALPAVTEPKLPTDGTSYEIDARLRAIVQEGLSVYRVDADALGALEPDVVLTQTQCEVCAVSESDVGRALAAWSGARPEVVSLEPNALDDVWDDARRIASALEVPDRGDRLVRGLRARMRALAARTARLDERPSVACVEWIDPLMAAGNWMPELVEMAGGVVVFGEPGVHSPWIEWDDLVAADPDVVLVSPCGFDLPKTRSEMGGLTERPGWSDLRAVGAGRVALADGVAYFHRSGPRLVESLEILAEILHPEGLDFGHRGHAWDWYGGP